MSKNSNNITFTETVIANVKSEKVSMPYINPEWEEYMKLSDEEKAQVEIVPEKYIYNYIPEENLYGNYNELPERFSLVDRYPTYVYDQGSEGLCWAYAISSMFESNLLYTKNISERFSAQQLSHLISNGSPYNLNISYGMGLKHVQHVGFFNSVVPSGMVPMKWDDFDDTLDDDGKIILSNVVNKDKISYQIKNTTLFPIYDGTEDYIKMLKSYIKRYGAIYIGITAPMGNCYDEANNLIYYKKDVTGGEALGHAMIIVGWDDNYGTDLDEDGQPDGAWILQNSYGEYRTYPYLSYKSDIPVLYGVKEIVEKEWDNNYDMTLSPKIELDGIEIEQMKSFYDESFNEVQNSNALLQNIAVKGSLEVTYHKRNLKETLQNIEFSSGSQNSEYSIYISPDGNKNNYQLVDTIKTDLPGTYSVDCNNMELNSGVFSIKIVTNNGAIYTQVSAFTKNNENSDNSIINVDIDDGIEDIDRNIYYHFYITAKNIDRNIPIRVTIKYEDGTILESNRTIDLNESSSDFIVKQYSFPALTKKGSKFKIEISYNDEIIRTLDVVYNYGLEEGSGTEDDPFVIKTKRDFEFMEKLRTAYFILNNDIDLKAEEIKSVGGLKYNIRPTELCGNLDGNGHSIKNLYMETTSPDIDTGLFKNIENSTIKNLRIENANIVLNKPQGYYPKGGFHGIISSTINNSSFENVYVSGQIYGNNESNIGLFAGVGENITINNCYIVGNIKDVKGHVGGLIGSMGDGESTISNSVIISNIYGADKYYYETQIGGLIGSLFKEKVNFDNIYLVSNYDIEKTNNKSYKLETQIGTLFSTSESSSIQNYSNINIYNKYCEEHSCISTEDEKNNTNVINDLSNLKQLGLEAFNLDSSVWEKLNSNTLPTLKQFKNIFISDFPMDEITIKDNEEKDLTINIAPQNSSFPYYKLEVEDQEIAEVKGNKLKGVKTGTTDLIITALDGGNTVKTVKINVVNGKRKVKFIYDNVVDSVVIEDSYYVGTSITLLENDELNKTGKYLYGWKYKDKVYRTGDTFEVPNEDVTFISEYRFEPPELSTYEYSNEDNIIKNVICNTSIEKYINNLNLDKRQYTVMVYNTNGERVTEGNIGTGYITKIYNTDEEIIDYVNIVPGDVYLDGKVNSRDAGVTQQYLIGMKDELYGTPQYYAMDFTRDGKVRLNDVELIKRYVVKLYEPSEEEYYGENN
ncbi:MAG: hypothetical protein J6K42_03995 [Clostridia bacterium]|nr:hypothetical protein [Clostridia bacterium]